MNKVTFFSNYLNHHQLPFCKELVKLTNGSFNFVAQKAISEKRIALGYQNISNDYSFVVKTYESKKELDKAYKLADEADYVLFGSSNTDYIERRIRNNKITIKYSERLFRHDINIFNYLRAYRRVYVNHKKYNKNRLYMLCSSAYAAYDFNRFNTYIGKTYKWGYFPETRHYTNNTLLKNKNHRKIILLWVGRFMPLKHPEYIIDISKRLIKDGYDFEFNVIGNGEMEDYLRNEIEKKELNKYINILGSMRPEQVRDEMEKSNIFLFTSDKQEGWGVVLNEAMNSGCACVASHAIGSTGFLIKHRKNGFVYKDGDVDDLYNTVKELMSDSKLRDFICINAYKTISEVWNAKVAAERFLILADKLSKGEDTPFDDGPCSKALPIKDEDMYNYLVSDENS